MDFSVVLILPFAAAVALVTLLAAALKRPRPRLVWPFAISTLAVIPIFLRLPAADTLALWLFSVLWLAAWAAFGTIVGAVIAKLVLATASAIRPR